MATIKIPTTTISLSGSGGTYCGASTCTNNRKTNSNLSFFRFPRDPIRCRQWVLNCSRVDLETKTPEYLNKNLYLCAKHFCDEMFMNKNEKKSLIWSAIPTLFDFTKSRKSRFSPRSTRTALGLRPSQLPKKRTRRKRRAEREPAELDCDKSDETRDGFPSDDSMELSEIIWDLENCAKKTISLNDALGVIKTYLTSEQFSTLKQQIDENQEQQKADICAKWPTRGGIPYFFK